MPPYSPTGLTFSAAASMIGVLRSVFVAPEAMGFRVPPFPIQSRAIAPPHVHTPTDCFEMVRPNATSMGTPASPNMVPLKALWRLANEEMVGLDVFAIDREGAVSISVDSANPQGAAIGTARINPRPKSLLRRWPWQQFQRAMFGQSAGVFKTKTGVIEVSCAAGNGTLRTHLEPPIPGVRGGTLQRRRPSILP